MMDISAFIQHDLHLIGLGWMGLVYSLRVYQFARLPMPGETAPPKGNRNRGVLASYAATFLPWSFQATRRRPWLWIEFAVYHLGAASAIFVTIAHSFFPALLPDAARDPLSAIMALAATVGLVKLVRRISRKELRLISTPDDYFSLIALEVFFASGAFVLLKETPLSSMVFAIFTTLYLIYVPLSKVSHYVYYFLAALVTGARYGLRGVRPAVRRTA